MAGHIVLAVLAGLFLTRGDSLELRCPSQCHCHYMTSTNWRVDCAGLEWHTLPVDELLEDAVVELNAAHNRLSSLPSFPEELRLRILLLGENHLEHVTRETFRPLATLQELDLHSNRISEIDPGAFEDNPELISLQLEGNPLTLRDGPFLSSRSLLYLDLSNCKLEFLNVNFFSQLTSLMSLSLTGNPLQFLEMELLSPLVNLEELYLEQCRLTTLAAGTFAHQTQLELLVLSGNQLNTTNIPWQELMKGLVSLETLLLHDSALVELPKEMFATNSNLTYLDLSMNELSDMDVSGTLSPLLPHLTTLNLSESNLLWSLTKKAFLNTPKIEILDLSGSWLSAGDLSVALQPLQHLQEVDLSACNLTRVPDLPPSVEMLDISNNPLHSDSLSPLMRLPHLETLDLRGCSMTSIPQELLSVIGHLQKLQVSANMWLCDCDVAPLAKLDPKVGCMSDNGHVVWSRFLRDNQLDCHLTSEQLVQDNKLQLGMFKIFELNDTPPTWIVAVACFALLLFLSILMVTGLVILVKTSRRAATRNRQRMEQAVTGEEEAKHQADEAELINYLRAHRAYDAPGNQHLSPLHTHTYLPNTKKK